jgi:LPXTG-motif cell wall-anchored protein
LTSFSVFTTCIADDGEGYDNNAQAAFFGKYEYPKESETNQFNAAGEEILPSTGDNHFNQVQLLGFALLVVGLFINLRGKASEKICSVFSERCYFK